MLSNLMSYVQSTPFKTVTYSKAQSCDLSKALVTIVFFFFQLFWIFGQLCDVRITWRFDEAVTILKYGIDFQKLIRPDDPSVEQRFQALHRSLGFCNCPLLRETRRSNRIRNKVSVVLHLTLLHNENIYLKIKVFYVITIIIDTLSY